MPTPARRAMSSSEAERSADKVTAEVHRLLQRTFITPLDRDQIHRLINAMDDHYWQVRIRAARSLGRLKAVSALDILSAALNHEISNLRKEAAIALGEIGDLRAIPALEAALKDPDPDVRKLTQLALKNIQSANAAR